MQTDRQQTDKQIGLCLYEKDIDLRLSFPTYPHLRQKGVPFPEDAGQVFGEDSYANQ